jgi:hypothetical protein
MNCRQWRKVSTSTKCWKRPSLCMFQKLQPTWCTSTSALAVSTVLVSLPTFRPFWRKKGSKLKMPQVLQVVNFLLFVVDLPCPGLCLTDNFGLAIGSAPMEDLRAAAANLMEQPGALRQHLVGIFGTTEALDHRIHRLRTTTDYADFDVVLALATLRRVNIEIYDTRGDEYRQTIGPYGVAPMQDK